MGEQKKNTIHLVKLCVGVDSLEKLEAWRAQRRRETGVAETRHVTRMWPKQEEALLNGGSLYWVIKGVIQARQAVLRLDEVEGGDGIRRCGIVLAPELIRVAPAVRRPFQGWRYLKPQDAPSDLPSRREGDPDMPPELVAKLAEIGIL
ncbi:DUF1489 domain-containing protein [Vannielia litorea]|uniref:DUF1489 family protein n=1 Tax=Vannielia litorea TaxID=1217970 RepID=UPI001C972A8B|nr:DUF1489 domain-containing protein [Vannielia litorea]MBY6153828.1 DUF1489 domain-containing protein [Vannielia litorea]